MPRSNCGSLGKVLSVFLRPRLKLTSCFLNRFQSKPSSRPAPRRRATSSSRISPSRSKMTTTRRPIIRRRGRSTPPARSATSPTTRTPPPPTSCSRESRPARAHSRTISSTTEPQPWPRPARCLSGKHCHAPAHGCRELAAECRLLHK